MALSRNQRKNLVGLGIIIVGVIGFDVYWRLTHPAPLGRSAEEIQRHFEADLPLGTSKDSVMRYMQTHAGNAFSHDTSRSVSAVFRKVILPRPFPGHIFVSFSFDAENRLVERHVNPMIGAP